jgi:hypothetical protein
MQETRQSCSLTRPTGDLLKQHDGTTKFNHQAVVNSSSTIRDFAEKTKATFQEIATKFDLGIKITD